MIGGDYMKKLKQIGTIAIRGPDKKIVENNPIYEEVEVDESGFTEEEKKANRIYAEFLAEQYKVQHRMEA